MLYAPFLLPDAADAAFRCRRHFFLILLFLLALSLLLRCFTIRMFFDAEFRDTRFSVVADAAADAERASRFAMMFSPADICWHAPPPPPMPPLLIIFIVDDGDAASIAGAAAFFAPRSARLLFCRRRFWRAC